MQRCRLALRKPREQRREMARQVIGTHWSEEGAPQDVILNLLSIYQTVIGRTLIPHNPRVMLSTFSRRLKPPVSAMQTWANKQIEHINLANTLRRIVTDALYSIGIAKVSLATPAQSAAAAWNLRAGEAMVSQVDLDDFVFDIHARDFSEVAFIGHRFRCPLDAVKDSKLYDKAGRDALTASYDKLFNLEGDERISALGRTMYAADSEEYHNMVDLWEVYLPRERLVVTLHEDQLTGPTGANGFTHSEPLRTQSWIGPDRGPYHILGYVSVPGNAMPKGPMQDLMDLHLAANRTYRKLRYTIDNLKEIIAARAGSDDGDKIMKANHNDIITLADPTNIQQMVIGGQSAQTLTAIATVWKDLFSFQGGNIELLGGRGPQSRTATQDTMLANNANVGVQDLQDQTTDFVSEVCRSLCWFWWHDPTKVMKTKHTLPGLPDMDIIRRVFPKGAQRRNGQQRLLQRNGRFEELDIMVDPYSLQHATPQSKLRDLNQVVQTIVLPMMQLLVQQGKSFDIDAYLQKVAQWMDQPDLADIVTISEPPDTEQGPSQPDKPPMPAATHREYTRTSNPGRTQKGDDQMLINRMLGNNPGGNPAMTSKNGTVG